MNQTRSLERGLGQWVRSALPPGPAEFVMFVLKQGWACLFGGLLLGAVIFTNAIWADSWPLARYDALFAFAVLTQAAMLLFRLETWREAKVIALRLRKPPKGYANWSLRLLAEHVVELGLVEAVSHETIRRTLKKTA